MRILHISNDEKFIDSAIDLFGSVLPDGCGYLINGQSVDSLRFVKSRPKNLFVFPYFSDAYFRTIQTFEPDVLFVHSYSDKHKELLERLGNDCPVFWSSWGRDIYSSNRLSHLMYKPRTRRLVNKLSRISSLKRMIARLVPGIGSAYKSFATEDYIGHCQFMSAVVMEDFELLKATYPERTSHIQYIPFNYHVPFVDHDDRSPKLNIIVGNSANPDNNHVESFDLIRGFDFHDRKVYVPLSYGGTRGYVAEVLKCGERAFGKSFVPLLSFLPLADYEAILDSVGFAIMNHSHQHAMGNILSLLFKGTKIYMDPGNSAYQALDRMGAVVSDISRISSDIFYDGLTQSEIQRNKGVVNTHYSRTALLKQTNSLIEALQNSLPSAKHY